MKLRKNRTWSRRQVLAALGASVAAAPFVPLLESAADGPEDCPKRLLLWFHPHGTIKSHWAPTVMDNQLVLPEILSPLDPFKDQLTVIDGLDMLPTGLIGGQHTVGPAFLFTGSELLPGNFVHQAVGVEHGWASAPSVEQVIANEVGLDSAIRSLEFGVQPGGNHPGSRISYAAGDVPLTPEGDPAVMFDRLFGESGLDPGEAAKIKAERLAVIDTVKPQLDALQSKVSQSDRIKIEKHLDAINEQSSFFGTEYTCGAVPEPNVDNPNDFAQIADVSRAQLDLLFEAFACNITNVASMMYRRGENDNFPYPELGFLDTHHTLSHANDADQDSKQKLIDIYRFYNEQLAYLATRMSQHMEPNGKTMLENTIILCGTEVAKGNNHTWADMPFAVLGNGQDSFKGNQYLSYNGRSHNQLLLTVCQAMGLDINTFGDFDDNTGPLTEMFA